MKKVYSVKAGLEKAAKYCAFQERCQQDVRKKLYDWGLYGDEVEEVIAALISENFINEERYADAYVRGHFNLKKWGRIKIKQGLKQKEISDYCINKAFKEIKEEEYRNTLIEIARKKLDQVNEDNPYAKKQKVARFLLQRGFENSLIWETLGIIEQD